MSEGSQKRNVFHQLNWWLVILISFAIGVLAALLGISSPMNFRWFTLIPRFQGFGVLESVILDLIAGVGIAFLAWIVSILIHEVGHAVMGWLNGFSMQFFVIGPLWVYRELGSWKTLWLKHPIAVGLYGGFPKYNDHLERRYLFMLLGGVSANILVALIIYVALSQFGMEISPYRNPTWSSILQIFLCGSLVVNLVLLFELFPIHRKSGLRSDGAQLLRIIRHDPKLSRDMAITTLFTNAQFGVPASAWDSKVIALATSIEDHSIESVLAHWLAYSAAIEINKIDLAEKHIKQAFADIDTLAELQRPNLYLEMAYFLAIHEGNVAEAKTALEHSQGQAVLPLVRLRAEAAVAFAEQDFDQAIVKAESMLEDFKKRKEPVAARLEAEQMRALITSAKQAKV